MKKIILFFIFLFLSFIILAEDVIINDISISKDVKGSSFFPLLVGEKWKWSISGMGNITELNWEVISAHKITDNSVELDKVTAFKIEAVEFFDEWYILEHDGYICYYKEYNENKIERILPIKPQLEDEWMNGDIKLNVTEIEENMVKVEFVDEMSDKYGYYKFLNDLGPYEIFEKISSTDEKSDMMMTVVENVSYKDILGDSSDYYVLKTETNDKEESTEKKNDFIEYENDSLEKEKVVIEEKKVVIEEKKEETEKIIIEEVKIKEKFDVTDYEISEEDYLKSLKKGKRYIQIGAFNVIYYAKTTLQRTKKLGFDVKIYKDEDGFYKVLIIPSNKAEDIIKEIRKKINKDAFIKVKK